MLQKIKWTNCWPCNYSPSRLIKQFPACPPTSSGDVLAKSNRIIAAVTSLHTHLRNKLDAMSSPWRNWWFSSAVFDCQMQTTWQRCNPFTGNWKKTSLFFPRLRKPQGGKVLKCAYFVCDFFFLRGKGFFFCHDRLLQEKVLMLLETSQANQSVHSSLLQMLSLP